MKVCLINGPRYNCKASSKSTVPLPLAYLAAYVRQRGHSVRCIDGILVGSPRRIARLAAAGEPDVVGVATNTNDRFAGITTIAAIRQALPRAFIVGGGHHFAQAPEDALRRIDALDAVVVGQGEETLAELLECLPDTDALGRIQGLVWRDRDGQIVFNEPRPLMKDINGLPMPAWELFDLSAYDMRMINADEDRMLGVMTMRGCPHRCVFCGSSITRRVQFLAPELAVDQLEHLRKNYGMTAFRLYDDTPLVRKSHAMAFCEEILRRDLKLEWWGNSRAQHLDPDVLALMRRSGCKVISLGVESGSDKVLRASKKDVTAEEMVEAFENVARAGFEKVTVCLLLGLPGESPQTIDESVAVVRKLRAIVGEAWHTHSMIGQLPLMYPGTELEAISKHQGTLPEDFSWNAPYIDPNWHCPVISTRYWAVPHFVNPDFPISAICRHLRRFYWKELSPGRKRRFLRAPLRRLQHSLRLKKPVAARAP